MPEERISVDVEDKGTASSYSDEEVAYESTENAKKSWFATVKETVCDRQFQLNFGIAFLAIALLGIATGVPLGMYARRPPTKVYYLQADLVLWDYAPKGSVDGISRCSGQPYTEVESVYINNYIGSKYYKAVWRQYTGPDYKVRVPRAPEWQHLGFLGPLMDLEVGDVVEVHVRNNVLMDVSFDIQGLERLPESDDVNRLLVTGQKGYYKYLVTETAAADTSSDVQTKLWLYRSVVQPENGDYAGLVGPVLVRRPGFEPPRQFISVLHVSNENKSPLLYQSLGLSKQAISSITDPEFVESNVMHGINGYIYCEAPNYDVRQGETVYWHVAGLGNIVDVHTAHWHGNTGLVDGRRSDEIILIPGSTASIAMNMINTGIWLMHCHVNDHFTSGMIVLYNVWGPGEKILGLPAFPQQIPTSVLAQPEPSGRVREYWVVAEEGEWDYAPANGNLCPDNNRRRALLQATPKPWNADQLVYTGSDPVDGSPRIGTKFIKARFVEYEANFTAPKPRPEEDAYLGILGPIYRAEVGDVIVVHLMNNLSSDTTMHPHGVQYNKASEGAMYNDGTPADEHEDDMIMPGVTYTFTWAVPETSGPGPNDGSSILWQYHGHTNGEQYAGLFGAIVITRKGMADKETARPTDVAHEFVVHYSVIDETSSYLYDTNVAKYLPGLNATQVAALGDDAGFTESMLKYSLNGYMYCNGPTMKATQGDRVRFYFMSLGTEVDMHSPRLTATTLDSDGLSMGATELLPGIIHTVDAQLSTAGELILSCGVQAHVTAGMRALVEVDPNPSYAVPASGVVRRYYIQAEKVEWSYAPKGNHCPAAFTRLAPGEGLTLDFFAKRKLLQSGDSIAAPQEVANAQIGDSLAGIFTQNGTSTIGPLYKKYLFVQYTDANFTTKVPQPAWNGLLGPTIRAEVGDVVEIVLRNAITDDVEFSSINLEVIGGVVPEGDLYAAVSPGETVTLRYDIPESAGPAEMDLSTVAYVYQSTVKETVHANEGLVGAFIVGKKGAFQADGTPRGVDYDVPMIFSIFDENWSELLPESAADAGIDQTAAGFSSVLYDLGNQKHSVNGYVFCNLEVMVQSKSLVRVYVMSVGSQSDLQSPRFSGLPVVSTNWAFYAPSVFPMVTRTVDIFAQTDGVHQVVTTVTDNYNYGMRALINVGQFAKKVYKVGHRPYYDTLV